MANKTINQLSQIDSLAGGDEFPIYDESTGTTKKATVNQINDFVADGAITDAINALDVSGVGGSGKYIAGISETDGKITAVEGTIDSAVTSGSGNPVSGDAVNTEIIKKADKTDLAVPSDAVLHYSFDELPDMPDGTADVRLTDGNTYQLQSTTAKLNNNSGTSFSNVNGNVQAVITGGSATGCWISNSVTSGKLIKIKIKITSLVGTLSILDGNTTIGQKTNVDNVEVEILRIFNGTLWIYCMDSGNSCTFTIEEIYIGDGSYVTPIIDNANGKWNSVSQSGVAVQGVSGKGVYQPSNQIIGIGSFNLTNNFTISLWIKPDNNTNNEFSSILDKAEQFYLRNGDNYGNNKLFFALYNSDNSSWQRYFLNNLLQSDDFTLVTVVKNESIIKLYLNGKVSKTYSYPYSINLNNNNCNIGHINNTRPQSYDDLLIFDRALSEEEVKALYLNKANTPKYYDINNYKLTGIPTPPTADGNYVLVANISSGVLTYSWVAQS